jgi:hypothetical protein
MKFSGGISALVAFGGTFNRTKEKSMRNRIVHHLAAAVCVSLAVLANSQEAGQDKAALVAAVKMRAERQVRCNAEINRILAKVNQLSPSERKAALFFELKNSTVLQEARNAETGDSTASGAALARSEQAAKNREIIAKVNQLEIIARDPALQQAMQELKGKHGETSGKPGPAR